MRSRTYHLALISVFLLSIPPARAQQAASGPVTTAFRADAERLSRNLVAAADDMPATKYQFKPTPAQMSVAEVVLHIAGDSEFGCARSEERRVGKECRYRCWQDHEKK